MAKATPSTASVRKDATPADVSHINPLAHTHPEDTMVAVSSVLNFLQGTLVAMGEQESSTYDLSDGEGFGAGLNLILGTCQAALAVPAGAERRCSMSTFYLEHDLIHPASEIVGKLRDAIAAIGDRADTTTAAAEVDRLRDLLDDADIAAIQARKGTAPAVSDLRASAADYCDSMNAFFDLAEREIKEKNTTDFDNIEFLLNGAKADRCLLSLCSFELAQASGNHFSALRVLAGHPWGTRSPKSLASWTVGVLIAHLGRTWRYASPPSMPRRQPRRGSPSHALPVARATPAPAFPDRHRVRTRRTRWHFQKAGWVVGSPACSSPRPTMSAARSRTFPRPASVG